jgi:hypothetical protein
MTDGRLRPANNQKSAGKHPLTTRANLPSTLCPVIRRPSNNAIPEPAYPLEPPRPTVLS